MRHDVRAVAGLLAALERRPEGATMGALSRALLVSNGSETMTSLREHSKVLDRFTARFRNR